MCRNIACVAQLAKLYYRAARYGHAREPGLSSCVSVPPSTPCHLIRDAQLLFGSAMFSLASFVVRPHGGGVFVSRARTHAAVVPRPIGRRRWPAGSALHARRRVRVCRGVPRSTCSVGIARHASRVSCAEEKVDEAYGFAAVAVIDRGRGDMH